MKDIKKLKREFAENLYVMFSAVGVKLPKKKFVKAVSSDLDNLIREVLIDYDKWLCMGSWGLKEEEVLSPSKCVDEYLNQSK